MFHHINCRCLPEDHPDSVGAELLVRKDRIIPRQPYSDIYTEPSFDYVIVKTSEKVMSERGGSLYIATNRFWYAEERISNYTFVISVVDQIFQRV